MVVNNSNFSKEFPPRYNFISKVLHRITADLRSLYEKMYPNCMPVVERIIDHEQASSLVYNCLSADKPSMIARFGGCELYTVANYLGVKRGIRGAFDFVRAKQDQWWWVKNRMEAIRDYSGFFPIEEWAICKFSELLLDDMKYVDLLGSFNSREYLFNEYIKDISKCHLLLLEPWFGSKPWTRLLYGKKVLVVHPFAELIEAQYNNRRSELFPGTDILPEFQLKTVKAVQSLGGDNIDFSTWFDALQWMKDRMDECDYDICLIGCGAYGFHLAAHAKRQGKKAVHLGGVLQMLFGIKGNRWEDPNYGLPAVGIPYGWYQKLFNPAWIKPDDTFRPKNAEQVEGACYW